MAFFKLIIIYFETWVNSRSTVKWVYKKLHNVIDILSL